LVWFIHRGSRAALPAQAGKNQSDSGQIVLSIATLQFGARIFYGKGRMRARQNCIFLEPAPVALDIASKPFAFYGIHMKHTVEPGELEIMAGNSSSGTDLQKAILTMTK